MQYCSLNERIFLLNLLVLRHEQRCLCSHIHDGFPRTDLSTPVLMRYHISAMRYHINWCDAIAPLTRHHISVMRYQH